MKPPKTDDILVHNGNQRLYAVKFVDGKPYPWNKLTGYIWLVNWDNWQEYERLPLDDVETAPAGAGGMR